MGLEMFGGSALGIVYRIVAFVIGGMREKSKNREDALNARISGNTAGINTGDDNETTHCANYVAVMFAVCLCLLMLICTFFPHAEFTRVLYQSGDADRYIDLYFFKWTWSANLVKYTVTSSSGDFVYSGFQVMQFCITALYKPK